MLPCGSSLVYEFDDTASILRFRINTAMLYPHVGRSQVALTLPNATHLTAHWRLNYNKCDKKGIVTLSGIAPR
jgi:hypothetical protein